MNFFKVYENIGGNPIRPYIENFMTKYGVAADVLTLGHTNIDFLVIICDSLLNLTDTLNSQAGLTIVDLDDIHEYITFSVAAKYLEVNESYSDDTFNHILGSMKNLYEGSSVTYIHVLDLY